MLSRPLKETEIWFWDKPRFSDMEGILWSLDEISAWQNSPMDEGMETYHHIICMTWRAGQFLTPVLWSRTTQLYFSPDGTNIHNLSPLAIQSPNIPSLFLLEMRCLLHQELLMVISVISAWSRMFLCKKISQWKATSEANIPQSHWESSNSNRKTGAGTCFMAKADSEPGVAE